MEPMALGSPGGSPAAGSPYLPAFLMGESNNNPMTPRSNTLSPTKGRSLFATSPGAGPTSPPDFNRSMGQKNPFGYQQTTPTHNFPGTPVHHNASISGPPTQSLFDSLRSEVNQVQTPIRGNQAGQSIQLGNQSFQANQSINDSYLGHASFNTSRITSPISAFNPNDFRSNNYTSHFAAASVPKFSDFWITVYGFPQSATSMILTHFSQCGTIIDKVFPSQGGNWVHLKYSSRLECDKALNYHEKILGNNIMVGVTHCKETGLVDKENQYENAPISKVRPLAHAAYKSAQSPTAVVTPFAPQRSSGLVNKAMDLLFGW